MCVPELIPDSEQDSALSRGRWLCFALSSQDNRWGNISWACGSCGSCCRGPWLSGGAGLWGGVMHPCSESDGDSHLGDSAERLSHQHTRAWFDSSLAQKGFGGPLFPPCLPGAHGQAGSGATTLLSCTLSPKQKGRRGLAPGEREMKRKLVLEGRG